MTPVRFDLRQFVITEKQFDNLASEFFGRVALTTIEDDQVHVEFNAAKANQFGFGAKETESSLIARFGQALSCYRRGAR